MAWLTNHLLADWLADQQTDWLNNWWTDCLTDWLMVWQTNWVTNCPTDWETDRQTDRIFHHFTNWSTVNLSKRLNVLTDQISRKWLCWVELLFFSFAWQVLSDNTLINLVPGGADKFVDYEERTEYIRVVRNCRMAEGKAQVCKFP